MSHQKDESLAFDYLNPVLDSDSYVYCSPDPPYHDTYSREPTRSSFTAYSDFENHSENGKLDNQYTSVPRNMFSSETFESTSKGYSRTFSGNDLLSENSMPERILRRFNSDLPSYCNYAIYDPFQGSPLEIANLGLLESQPVEHSYHVNEESYETELIQEEPSEMVQSKRTYKDVLTFPTQSDIAGNLLETPKKLKPENEFRKESYKEKLTNTKLDASTLSKPVPTKAPLNNHHNRVNSNLKRPLKINNNFVTGNASKSSMKSPSEKNWHSVNESVRSVRSQTDLGGLKKKNRMFPVDGLSFELNSPSEDECVTPTEVRSRDSKKMDKTKMKNREKETEKQSKRQSKRNPPPNSSATFARSFFPKLVRAFWVSCLWLYHLCMDVIQMSCNLTWFGIQESCKALWGKSFVAVEWIKMKSRILSQYVINWLPTFYEIFGFFCRKSSTDDTNNGLGGLNSNIPLPSTGEEAMHRLLACKGRDPYSILGVRRDCSDEEIRRYYKRQAVLVHPDKNRQRGAEEAFKILAHAFELVGQPDRRSHYDQLVQEADEMETAWAELNDLLSKLHAKMDEAANTIRCTNCAKRHRRVKTNRPCYAARYCQDCKIHHSAREGDLWAESRYMGFRSKYYACMEGAVYDITEWANCQAGHLRHLQSNSHRVQYRIVPGQGNAGNGGRKSS